uniref:EF-hand domain-containing protein n=1 Tax=Helicotheca tamesis TaxID=374047 RepID=A0A6U0ENB9_9STRA|mmetsp:Transcript_12580/g.17327  ORF Transcript_12580/g.17327 Transcript_12580/m.17327 type:complete len:573 (+) Transcript_12580:108-1826(+)
MIDLWKCSAIDGNDTCGWIAAIVAMVCFGTFGVPIKGDAANSVDIDPLVMQSYKTIMCFVTSWVVLPLEGFTFTPWGIVSGLFWVPSGVMAIYAIRNAGLAVSQGTWSSIIVLVSFVWGVFIFNEHVKSKLNACFAILLMMMGLWGMSYYSAPTEDDDDDDDDDENFLEDEPRPSPYDLNSSLDNLSVGSRSSRISNGSYFARRKNAIIEFFNKNANLPLNKRSRQEHIFAVCAGVCLSFNSGFINGCCLSGLLTESGSIIQPVSGFTGGYTKAGLGLAEGDTAFFGFEVSMIFSFIGGSCIASMINPRPVPHQLGPTYGPTFLVGSVLLVIACILSSTHPEQKNLFYFAAAANGLQNCMSSMYSANLIRTTHLTGTSTDIGLFLGQLLRGNFANTWKLGVLTSLAISFWLGSFTSFYAVMRYRGYALIFNACLFFLIGVMSIVWVKYVQHVSFWRAASGMWHWQKALNALNVTISERHKATKSYKHDFMEVFDQMDVNRTGSLGAEELYLALKASGMRITKKGAKALIDSADGDGDGKISKEEWMRVVLETQSSTVMDSSDSVFAQPKGKT